MAKGDLVEVHREKGLGRVLVAEGSPKHQEWLNRKANTAEHLARNANVEATWARDKANVLSKARAHLDKETERKEHAPKIAGHDTGAHSGYHEKLQDLAAKDAELYHYRPEHKGEKEIKFKKSSDKQVYDDAFSKAREREDTEKEDT